MNGYYERIDLSEGIDPVISNNSKECIVCHYWFFNRGFKFQNSVCNGSHDLTMLCLSISNIVIITIKGVDYCCIIHNISKSEAIHLLEMIIGMYKMHIKEINTESLQILF